MSDIAILQQLTREERSTQWMLVMRAVASAEHQKIRKRAHVDRNGMMPDRCHRHAGSELYLAQVRPTTAIAKDGKSSVWQISCAPTLVEMQVPINERYSDYHPAGAT